MARLDFVRRVIFIRYAVGALLLNFLVFAFAKTEYHVDMRTYIVTHDLNLFSIVMRSFRHENSTLNFKRA